MSDALDSLLAAFCEGRNEPAPKGTDLGMDADLEGRSVSVLPARLIDARAQPASDHERDAMEIRVQVARWTPSEAENELPLLLLLHAMNARAVGLHRWRAHVDDEGVVHLCGLFDLSGLGPAELDALISDGLSRATVLADILAQELEGVPDNTSETRLPASWPPAHAIRP